MHHVRPCRDRVGDDASIFRDSDRSRLMNIFCTGINHHDAPVEVRERFSVPSHETASVLREVREIDGLEEAVVVSTCNRVEFYTAGRCLARSRAGIRDFFASRVGMDAPVYQHDTPVAAKHLFRVASGLDSMVLGETEILGQLKQAYAAASDAGATSRLLNRLFQTAFRVAKSVRSQTGITRGPTSVGAVAVELAGQIFGDLSNHRVMVLGAGETGERTARSLISRGVKTVIVSNRRFARAAALAAEIGGTAIPFDLWQREFDEVDILISSTSAPHYLLDRRNLESVVERRAGRPLFLIDLAVPRDIAPDVRALENVFLYDIDSLADIASRAVAVRQQEVETCERIIDGHVGEFVSWMNRTAQPSAVRL